MKKQSERPSDLDILRFRQECFNFIKEIFGKILERSPLKFKLTRSISCFSPHIIQLKLAISRIKSLLNIFVDNRRMSSNSAEQCRKQFSELWLRLICSSPFKYERKNGSTGPLFRQYLPFPV
jgi:hypothetical protein